MRALVVCTSWAPSAMKRAASTTSCGAVPVVRATAPAASTLVGRRGVAALATAGTSARLVAGGRAGRGEAAPKAIARAQKKVEERNSVSASTRSNTTT